MKIGIDMLPVQSPGSRLRGVGRYARDLVLAMLRRGGHDFVLYAHEGFPSDQIPDHQPIRTIAVDPDRGEATIRQAMDRLVGENPDGLDALLILNPFELCPGYDPPASRGSRGPRLSAIVYDFIPFLNPEHYLSDPGNADWFYRRLRAISRYDSLLAISDATRDDAIRLMGVDPDRVRNISGASDPSFFVPDRSKPMPFLVRQTLAGLRITRPFVLTVAGADERKNVRGLISAFSRLPRTVRDRHQLVVACKLKPEDAAKLVAIAESVGVRDSLVLTGEVSDEALRTLYQRCAVFAFPSLYEGFGLPILEAMHCGAPVVAGRNSSQIEVVGDSGLLVDASDPAAIASGIESILAEPNLAAKMASTGIAHARGFDWDRSADRAIAAIESHNGLARYAPRVRSRPRSRIAVVSPWRPKKSGISTYAAWLVGELASTYRVDLYHDTGYVPDLALGRDGFAAFDHRLLERNARSRNYSAILYQMGNSPYHGFLYDLMAKVPGIVTLHDFSLAGFQYWRASESDDPAATFADTIRACEPGRALGILASLDAWKHEPGGMQDAMTRRGIHLNREVLARARRVIVHSGWCVEQSPEFASKMRVIPHGAWPVGHSVGSRYEARQRFGIAADALVVGSFGFLSNGKMNVEALRAFAVLVGERPDALFVFVGDDCEAGEAEREASRLGIKSRVRFHGHLSDPDFLAMISATDIGVSLRRPPTYGETSGALLNLLRHGVPTIVNDVATFGDFPDDAVAKVRWDRDGHDGLVRAMRLLANNPDRRASLASRALDLVASAHAWPVVASQYVAVIDEHASARAKEVA